MFRDLIMIHIHLGGLKVVVSAAMSCFGISHGAYTDGELSTSHLHVTFNV